MFRKSRYQRWSTKNIVVGCIAFLILALVIKGVYGNIIRPSLAYTTLDNGEMLATQAQIMQPKMDIKAIQTSLEDVLQKYQEVIQSANKTSKDTLVSEVAKLYLIAASDNTKMKSFVPSANNPQIIDDLTQGSDCLAASLFEMKDSLSYEGDFSATQLKNSQNDLRLAIKNLEQVRQELKN
ncbi:exported hypothetical protein [Candidatus Desulfosporosinus infrequens]|uniref:Uncharacterized protein n=1 Tax=Candidatus Desulfosporosinus infrequens TaxID=2043169 RepID=A0A2U3LHQ3_9FIRM|nr:exported hypothetical protein [Candidatus Desulfosporosinus infrequens]